MLVLLPSSWGSSDITENLKIMVDDMSFLIPPLMLTLYTSESYVSINSVSVETRERIS